MISPEKPRARLVHVFKNWKLLFENIYENTCEWKNALKWIKCCLKTKNGCLKTQTKHPQGIRTIGEKKKKKKTHQKCIQLKKDVKISEDTKEIF